MAFPLTLVLGAILVAMVVVKHFLPRKEETILLPPGPPKLPIIGNLHLLGAHGHRSLQDLATIHGPLMLLHFGKIPVLVASTADVAKEILKTHDLSFCSRPRMIASDRLFYNSRDVGFAPYSEHWRQAKKVCVLHLLSIRQVKSAQAMRENEVINMIAKITTASTSGPLNLTEALVELSKSILFRVAFGKRYSGESRIRKMFHEFVELMGFFNIADFIPSLAWVNRFNGINARVEKSSREMDNLLERVLNSRHENGGQGGGEGDEDNFNFLDILLSLEKNSADGFSLDRDGIKAILLDMFLGGIHTTATVMDWAMVEMIRHPEVLKKAQNEAREIGRGKQMLVEEDIQHMTYLNTVIKEALRLHPPGGLLVPRESIKDVELQGYHIARETRVLVNVWAIGRDPVAWARPEEFWPERFTQVEDVDYKGLDFRLIPFGAGRRICPAISFGMRIVELALANLLYGFDWELPVGVNGKDMDMTEAVGITAGRKASLVVIAKPWRGFA